jgi:hypothetical protein
MRRAAQVDGNQAVVVAALRRVGALVQHLHQVGGGCPDLLVGFRRQLILLEVKPAHGERHQLELNENERAWHRLWNTLPVHVVHSPEEALRVIGAIG